MVTIHPHTEHNSGALTPLLIESTMPGLYGAKECGRKQVAVAESSVDIVLRC